MIDARLSIGLPNHPKTKKLIRKLGTDAAWRLVCLILWVAQNRPNGDLSGLDTEDLELSVDWPGEEGEFVKALVDVGFLDFDSDSENFTMHDWGEHNPWAAGSEARSEKARWLATCKHHGREKAAELMPEYAARLLRSASSTQVAEDSKQEAQNSSAPSPLPSPYPLPLPINPISEQTTSTDKALPPVDNLPSPSSSSKSSPTAEKQKASAAKQRIAWLRDLERRRFGVEVKVGDESDPRLIAMIEAGVSDAVFEDAYRQAVQQRADQGDTGPINVGYLESVVASILGKTNKDPKRSAVMAVAARWYETASGIEAKGVELGIEPAKPETGGFPAFKARVFKAAGMAIALCNIYMRESGADEPE